MYTPAFRLLLFDWGDTLMRDFKDKEGPMCYWDEVEVVDGVTDFLAMCYERYPMMVASNSGYSTTDMMIKALNRGGIDRYFSRFFTSKDLKTEKPDPRFFELICQATGFAPADIVYFGNDYRKDIESAKKAGLQTRFFNENNIAGPFPDADVVFYRFDELRM